MNCLSETEKLPDQQDRTCFLFICLIGRIDLYMNLNVAKELKCGFMASEFLLSNWNFINFL